VLAVLSAHIGEPPVLPGAPPPAFTPEVVMGEP